MRRWISEWWLVALGGLLTIILLWVMIFFIIDVRKDIWLVSATVVVSIFIIWACVWSTWAVNKD